MRIFRKNADERQEIEVRRICSDACLIGIFGLVVAIIVQLYVFNLGFVDTTTQI
jgi:hypothetical protein